MKEEDPVEIRELVREFLPLRMDGADLSKLRKQMELMGAEEAHIRIAIRRIDDLHLEQMELKSARTKALENLVLGVLLLFIGGVITLLSLTGYIGSRYVVVFFGPIFYGAFLAYQSWEKFKQNKS